MSSSPIVSLLANRPPEELEGLRKKMQGEKDKLAADIARLDLELQQVEDAIARQSRRRGAKSAPSGPTAGDLVFEFIAGADEPVSPAQAWTALKQRDDFNGTRSAVYNAVKRLSDQGKITRLEDGMYVPAGSSQSPPEAPVTNGTAPSAPPAGSPDLGPGGIPGAHSGSPADAAGANRP